MRPGGPGKDLGKRSAGPESAEAEGRGNSWPSTHRTFQPRFEIFPPAQQALWPELCGASRMGFVLYGGTAIALRLGHRQSVDFDFFTERSFDHGKLVEGLPFLGRAMVLQEERDTLTFSVGPTDPAQLPVKVSFFTVGMGRIGTPEWTHDGVMLVASMEDLMAHKLKVVLQRLEKKDYLDIHALVAHGYRLEDGLAGARALFGRAFQPVEALKALAYFKGGDLHELPWDLQRDLVQAAAGVGGLPALPAVRESLRGDAE